MAAEEVLFPCTFSSFILLFFVSVAAQLKGKRLMNMTSKTMFWKLNLLKGIGTTLHISVTAVVA